MRFLRNLLWRFGGRTARERILAESLKPWRIVRLENEGAVGILRLRITKPPLPAGVVLSTAVTIDWSYDSDDGLPLPDTKTAMDAFEVATEELTCDNDFAELVMVRTGFGTRE